MLDDMARKQYGEKGWLVVNDVLPLQKFVGPHHRVGIDLQLYGQFPYRRNAFAGLPLFEQDAFADVIGDLQIYGYRFSELHVTVFKAYTCFSFNR